MVEVADEPGRFSVMRPHALHRCSHGPCEVKAMLKELAKKIVYGHKATSGSFVKYLRSLGMVIGEEVHFYAPMKCIIDTQHPWMIEIGNNVHITEGVTILTHGYDWSVLKGKYGDVLGSAGHVKIGNNVFVGMGATILKGVTVGNNVIIGADSVVCHDIPDDSVVAGNPARVIYSIEEYLHKRREAQLDEACELYTYWRRNSADGKAGKEPPRELFREFFFLFESRDASQLSAEEFSHVLDLCGNRALSEKRLCEAPRQFEGYEAFLSYLKSNGA